MQGKPTETRERTALALSLLLTLVITVGWLGGKSLLSGGEANIAVVTKESQTARASESMSAFESSKKSFDSTFKEIKTMYSSLKDSLGNVFVPFVTGIEVYERE